MYRWIATITLAVGCASPAELATFGALDGTDLLLDQPADAFAERVSLHPGARARLLPDAAPLSGGVASVRTPLVVVDPGPRPRISLDAGDVQVLLYLDRADLQAFVVGRGTGTGEGGQGRVLLEPGAPVEVLERREDRILVRLQHPELELQAWFPSGIADEVYRGEELSSQIQIPSPGGIPMVLRRDTQVLDAPHGAPLLWASSELGEGGGRVTVTGEAVRGYLPIAVRQRWLYVEGWAHVDDLRASGPLAFGSLGLSGVAWSSCGLRGYLQTCTIVPEGALLRAGPDGPVVGRTRADVPVSPEAWFEGTILSRETPLGRVELWAGPEVVEDLSDVTPGCR